MIIAALAEQGAEIPADLLPVEVCLAAGSYRTAFRVLSAARGHGPAGPLPIAYSEMVAYARANGLADTITECEEFVTLVQEQDEEFLKHAAKALEKKK